MSDEILNKLFPSEATEPSPAPAPVSSEPAGESEPAEAVSTGAEPGSEDTPAPAEGEPQETETPESSPAQKGQLQALTAERKKRQEAEARSAALEERLAAIEKRLSQEKEDEPEPETTPPEYYDNPAAFLRKVAREEQQRVREETESRQRQDVVAKSREEALSLYEDYETQETLFIGELKRNPYLLQHFQQSDNPAGFAYEYMTRIKPALENQTATTALQTSEKSRDASGRFVKSTEAQDQARLEQEKRVRAAAKAAAQMPPSQAGARGSGSKLGRVPATGDQLLNRMFPG